MYFNIEINILDYYSVECEKVHVLVFITYWNVLLLDSISSNAANNVYVMNKISMKFRLFWRNHEPCLTYVNAEHAEADVILWHLHR